jgi:phage terminase small subunit
MDANEPINTKPGEDLTDKQRRFCEEYAIDWNATRAAIAAGYSEKTAYSIGSENLKKPEVVEYLDYLRSNLAEAAGISALWAILEYKKQVESGITDLFSDWFSREEFKKLPESVKSCIKKIETRELSTNETQVKLEFYDKQTALKALRDMLGWDAPKQTQITGKDGEPLNPIGSVIVFGESARPLTVKEEKEEPGYIDGNDLAPGTPLDQL